MSWLASLLVFGASAAPLFTSPAPTRSHASAPYRGAFDAPPAFQYRVRLPGGRTNSATHAEWSTPVLVGDRIYLGSAADQAMVALDRTGGATRVRFPATNSVESEATVTDDAVFFCDTGGNTYRYTLDGELLWRHDGSAPILVAPTILEEDGLLLVSAVDDLVVALDADTGELEWQYHARRDPTRHAELTLFAAPRPFVVRSEERDLVVLGFSSGAVVAVDLESGEEVWKRSVGEGRYPDVVGDLVGEGNDVLASGYFGPFVAIDLPSHNVRWRVEAGSAHAPLVTTDRIVHPGSDGVLRAIAPLTGAELWRWDSGGSGALTTPVRTEAGLVIASSDGGVWIVDETTGAEVWRWHEPWLLTSISTPPAVEGRQMVFVTGSGWLYSMLVPTPSVPRRLWP